MKRAHYQLPTIDNTLGRISGARYFSTLDAASGFWQVPLDPTSAPLTTFITPFGRFHFNRLPFGITSAPEIFRQRISDLLDSIPHVLVFMDDILVFGSTEAEHDTTLAAVKKALADAHVVLNPTKCHIKQKSVKFLGHVISADGITPDPSKVAAITALPAPTNVAELRRALGMFNFLAKFLPDMAAVSAPLRVLLKSDSIWIWEEPQSTAFRALQRLASSAPCLVPFSTERAIRISADASSYGLGAVLLQPDGPAWRPVAYASRSLTEAEQRYAQIEKECLAVVWACEHFHNYVYGGPQFTVETDHKPLVPLINSTDLDRCLLRCQRLLLRLMRYNPKAIHVPGKSLVVADALSRAPAPTTASSNLAAAVESYVSAATSVHDDPKLGEVRAATLTCPDMTQLRAFLINGWPSKSTSVSKQLQPYYAVRNELSVVNDVVYRGGRPVIPTALRPSTLTSIHEGHQGIVKCRARARNSIWWPGMSADIERHIAVCPTCAANRPNPAEPLQPSTFPDLPWDKIALDLCEHQGKRYLVVVDYFSRFIEVAIMRSTTAEAIIQVLATIFATHGIPRTVVSDNGPQFACNAFHSFAAAQGFTHRTSSPGYAQSNGEAERAVQTAKRLIKTNADLQGALLSYRATPLANGYSPAQLLYGRQLRTTLPAVQHPPAWPDLESLRAKENAAKEHMARQYNDRHRARPLPVLPPGTLVFVPDLDKQGKVVRQVSDRSYMVQTHSAVVRRNRRQIRPLPSPPKPQSQVSKSAQQSSDTSFEVSYGPVVPPPAVFPLLPVSPPPSPGAVFARPQPPSRRPPSVRQRRLPARYSPV